MARFKPSVRAICAIGTVAHNRAFTARDLVEYAGTSAYPKRTGRTGAQLIAWLKKHGHIRSIGGVDAKRKYYPTAKGWKMIEKACKR